MSENGFSDNQFSNRIFPSTRSSQVIKTKKEIKKVVFTGRLLQGGVCSLYSIGETVQCIHSLLYVLDNVTNNTSPRTAACRPIAYVAYLLTTLA